MYRDAEAIMDAALLTDALGVEAVMMPEDATLMEDVVILELDLNIPV
jgi:hypothetical protein